METPEPQTIPVTSTHTPSAAFSPTPSEKNWALAIHLSVFLGMIIPMIGGFAPILFWLIKRNESKFLDASGKAATNLAITCTLGILLFVLPVLIMSFWILSIQPNMMPGANPWPESLWPVLTIRAVLSFLAGVIAIAWYVVSVIAAVKSQQGQVYSFRWVIRFFK